MKLEIKKDWWLVNSLINILSGVAFIVIKAIEGVMLGGLMLGGLNILVGIALLYRNRIIFWVVFVLSGGAFFRDLLLIVKALSGSGTFIPTISTALTVLSFAAAVMLWRQIKSDSKIK